MKILFTVLFVCLFHVAVISQCACTPVSSFPAVINGITVNVANSGDVQNYGANWPSCGLSAGPLWVGVNSSFSQTFTFSSPVNNVKYVITAASTSGANNGVSEEFIFTTSSGVLNATQCGSSCPFNQVGNTFSNYGNDDGTTVILNSSSTYSSFTVSGAGGSNGSLVGICVESIVADPCVTSPATAGASSGGVITCSGPNVALSGSGGVTYSWSGPSIISGASSANPVVNAGGTYNLTITDGNGCSASTSVFVSQNTNPPSPSASSGGVVTCSSPNVTLTGGGGGSYSWSGPSIISGATTANPLVNAGGTYNLTVTDGSNGCSAGTSVFVSQNTTPPSPSASAGGNITCSSPNVTLTGGGGGTYSWSGPSIISGATTANPVVNAGGTYNLTVTGGNGCTAGTSVNVTTNTTPPSPTASSGGVITCSTPNITLTGGGGGTYSWSGPSIVSGGATANPVVNAGGTYNLTVTGANGCTAGTSVNVTQSTILPTASSTAGTTNLNCLTTSTSLNGSATGGSGGYTYAWSPATGLSSSTAQNPTANPSSSTSYVLTVTDSNGCQNTSNVTINVNTTPPSATASAGGIITCSSPNVTLTGGGGGTYSWTGTGIVSGATTANPVVNQAGTFNVTVTGGNGCTANSSINVTQNTTVPSIALSTANTLSTTCASPNTNLSATSNANPTTVYTWLTPISTTLTGNPVNVSAAGIYTVFVTDTNNGCNTTTIPTTVQVIADANIPVVTLSTNAGTLTCLVTSIGVTANTTASPVTYNWLPTTGILSGANSATPVFNAAGNYSLTVTNTANSCASTGAANVVNITANNTNPTAGASTTSSVLNCTLTSIVLTGTGGGNYSWTGTGIVSGANTANPTINQVGVYSLVVTNPGNNCSSTNSATISITQNTTTPSFALGTASTLSTTCANPTATLSASSSADPTTIYTWLTPISTTLTGNPVSATASGIYTVFVTDTSSGCVSGSAASGTTLQIIPDANIPVVTLSSNTASITCANPTPSVSATVNPNTVSYSWNPTTGIVSGANTSSPTFDTPGSYSLVVTNTMNSCATAANSNVVTVVTTTTSPTITLSALANTGTITCANPSVIVTPTINPNTGLTYLWSPSAGLSSNPNQATATFTNAGVYNLAVTNTVTGCVSLVNATSSFTVSMDMNTPTVTTLPISANNIIGCGSNSSVTYSATVTSYNGSVAYNWQPSGSNNATATITTGGIQTLTVTDNVSGCKTITSFTVNSNNASPNVTTNASALFPCETNTTTLLASSTNSNVVYQWQGGIIVSGNATNSPIIGSVGLYTLTATDVITNCTYTQVVAVTQASISAGFSANPIVGTVPLLVNFTNASNPLTASFNWSFGDNGLDTIINPNHTYNNSGSYSVTLIASVGPCKDTAYAIIVVNEDATLIIPQFFTPNGDGKNDFFVITGIDKYPNNTLEIYNRWGSLVYLKKGYNNNWDGMTNQPSTGTGMLPSATYYIVLNLGTEEKKPYKGYIELKY